jgi:formylglycine-generating enzyme required for sulfatase activity/predicted Ser/Thr protein kinase
MSDSRHVDKYEILEELGRGGFAIVYKARDTTLDRLVALKVMHPYWTADPNFAARFQREARVAAQLRHSNIVTVYEAGEADGDLYIAMEYLPGSTLQDLLEARGALSLEEALPILEQVADALDYAHAQGVVHRDIKPSNVMLEEASQGVHATLMDFGLVKAMAGSSALTSQGTLLGSPEYMAPEQADPERSDEISPAADRYALGIVAYQMLTGRVPFPGNTPATLNAHEHKPVPPPRSLRPGLPPGVEEALMRMLAKAPGDRFETASAFVMALREAYLSDSQMRRRQAQIAPLYTQFKAAVARENWAEVLTLGGRIQALDTNYRDVRDQIAHARRRLRRPWFRLTPSQVRLFGRIGAAVVALVLLVTLVTTLGSKLWEAATVKPSAMSTKTPLLQPTITLYAAADAATRTPTQYPTEPPTETPSLSPSPPPTSEPTRSAGDPWLRPKDDMVMIYVPGGTFQMGSDDDGVDYALQLCSEHRDNCERSWFEDEQPVHGVTLDAFWIDKYEVTNVQYAVFLNEQGNQTEGGATWLDLDDEDCLIEEDGEQFQPRSGYADYPVIEVSWYGAAAYCEWSGARLPTEVEWEYAGRGPEGYVFPWGNTFDDTRLNFCDRNCPYAWEATEYDDKYEHVAPVASFPDGTSWCDALDMAGNVWEWVADWYGNYSSGAQTNPTGPETGDLRVLRGGSWYSDMSYARGAGRFGDSPDESYNRYGFRCARDSH